MTVQLQQLRKHQLKELQHRVQVELRRRYFDHRPPKYGTLNKTFRDEQEFMHLLFHVTNKKARMAFALQRAFGLSVLEAAKIRRHEDIDMGQRRLWVRSLKGRVPTSFYIHDKIFYKLQEYLCEMPESEWLFPREPRGRGKKYPHLSPEWLGKEFRLARARAGLEQVYNLSEESDPLRTPRRLNKLTTHSCRRRFIQDVHSNSKDILLTQKLARHRNVKNTLIYLHADEEQLDRVIVETFSFPPHSPHSPPG